MKKIIKNSLNIMLGAVLLSCFFSCKRSFLDVEPSGVLGDAQMASPNGVREALIGAYSDLDGQYDQDEGSWYQQQPDNWLFGSVAGGDAHKGSDPGDQAPALVVARLEGQPSNDYYNKKWIWLFDGMVRSNLVLKLAGRTEMDETEKANIVAQATFLHGFFAFEAKKMWNNVPWIDTTVSYAAGNYFVPNDEDISPKIEAELKFAYENLPETQDAVGRINKWAAGAFLAKFYLFEGKFDDAKPLLEEIIQNGTTPTGTPYGLQDQFSWNFNFDHNNSQESVFAIQASLNDGAQGFHGNIFDLLNYPYGGGAVTGCCGFFQPSIELANSYRTDADGLPLLDGPLDNPTYDLKDHAVKNDMGVSATDPFTPDEDNLDPRIDWTMGRRDIPYLDWGKHQGATWIRNQASAGPYSPKKNVFYESQIGSGGDNAKTQWAPLNAINYNYIRFAQVILWAAESEVEASNGSLEKAREYVNMIRHRAANPNGFVKDGNAPAAHYVISEYPAGSPMFSNKEDARKAVHFEEKLELAMEGHRFFDLVRWKEANTVINHYFQYEGQFTGDIKGAKFTDPANEYFPLPQHQIDLSNESLKQNAGYH